MSCADFDLLSSSDDPADRAALQQHAAQCAPCATRLEWEERLASAACAVRPRAPAGNLEQVLDRYRNAPEPILLRLRPGPRIALVLAASLVVAVFLWIGGPRPPAETTTTAGLLSEAALQQAEHLEAGLEQEHQDLQSLLVRSEPIKPLSPILEEASHLDAAIEECRQALEANHRHQHLRSRLMDLVRRRNELLRRAGDHQG